MPKSRVIPKRVFATKVFLAIALITPALAQNRLQSEQPAAASGPALDMSVGYCYLDMQVPGTGTVNLNGVDASGGIQFARHWGAIVDSSYVRGSNVFGTGHDSYVLSALAGPVFYPFERGMARLSIRALGGAGLVDGAVPVNGPSYYLHGWVTRPSYGVGVGLEHSLAGPFALRINGDYLRTAFVNSADVVQLQNNLRVTASLVVRLRQGAMLPSR
jgi:opacity protein-like surface antigen